MCKGNDEQDLIEKNKRAHLLSIYYEVASLDDENRLVMTREEFEKKFLNSLDKETRAQLKEMGFDLIDADNSNGIDVCEFERAVDKILQSAEERDLETLKKLNY